MKPVFENKYELGTAMHELDKISRGYFTIQKVDAHWAVTIHGVSKPIRRFGLKLIDVVSLIIKSDLAAPKAKPQAKKKTKKKGNKNGSSRA